MRGRIITGLLLAGLGVVAQPASAASQKPVTVTLTPKPSASANPKAAKAVLAKRLRALGIDGSVQQSGDQLVVTLPKGAGKVSPEQIVPGDVRFRPVLAEMSRVQGPEGVTASPEAVRACDVAAVTAATSASPTTVDADLPDVCIVADTVAGVSPANRYLLGPAALVGSDLKSAKSVFSPGNGNVLLMNLTEAGQLKFDALAGKLYGQQPPRDQVAFVVDRAVESNPSVQAPSFSGPVQISGGGVKGFTRAETRKLADIVNSGASPLGAYEISNVGPG